MLIVYTPISAIPARALSSLREIASKRPLTDTNPVVFEGKYFRIEELRAIPSGPQLLQG